MSERFVQDGKLEARVESTSQNAKGWYIRLLLHPSDTEEVTKLRVGAVLDIRWREVLNVDVEPIEVENPQGASTPLQTVPRPQADKAGISKPKRAFSDLPLSQQAALRCEDRAFWAYLELHSVKNVIDWVRNHCDVNSRSEFDTNPKAAAKWEELESMYQIYLLDIRYPEGERR